MSLQKIIKSQAKQQARKKQVNLKKNQKAINKMTIESPYLAIILYFK